jgi:hypothetical protein
MARVTKGSKTRRTAKETRKSTEIFWLVAGAKRVARDAHDYAHMDSVVQVWIKAGRKDAAMAFAKRQLVAHGWQLKKVILMTKVDAGFARIGSLMDPPVFTDDEADEWTERYYVADADGICCLFEHSDREQLKRTSGI